MVTVGNRALFLVSTTLTCARHCSLLSIWQPPLVTHHHTFDPRCPTFLEHRGPPSLPKLLTSPGSLRAGERPVVWGKCDPCLFLFQSHSLEIILMFQHLLQCFLLAFHLGKTRIMGRDEGNILWENI